MTVDASPRILIVGAGPTGLTAAVELARRGLVPVVVDARAGPSGLSRAVGITPRSLAHLAPSGVAEALIAEAVEPAEMLIYRGTSLAVRLPLHSPSAFHPTLLFLPQDRTEALLAQRLRDLGGEVVYGRRVVGLDGHDPVVVRFDDGGEARFDHVIGADGVDSTVRKAAGIGFPGYDLDRTWSVADVDATGWRHPGDFTVSLLPRGIAVVVPIGPGRYRLVANVPDAVAALPLPMDVSHVRRTGTFRISVRQADCYARDGVFLAGDAAHTHSPVGGRGMNTGIADAAVLAACLADGRAQDYTRQRHPIGRKVIRETEIARRLMTGENWAARAAMSAFLGLAAASPAFRRRMGRFGVEF